MEIDINIINDIKTALLNDEIYVCLSDYNRYLERKNIKLYSLHDGFNNILFSKIFRYIYYNNPRIFEKEIDLSKRTIGQYLEGKIIQLPNPILLRKLANISEGLVTYKKLMQVCGYLDGIED